MTKFLFALSAPVLLALPAQAALVTYTPDANTVALFHLDETSGTTAADTVSARVAVAFDGNPVINPAPAVSGVIGAAGYAGFGNAAAISAADVGLGFDVNNSGTFDPDNLSTADFITMGTLTSPGGSFSIDAMVNFTGSAVGGGNREIVATDSSAATRGFQFRLNNAGQLEFNFISTAAAAFTAAVPTAGADAYASNTWFHVALTFDGGTNAASFYWTKVDPSVTSASLLATGTEQISLAVTGPLVIGNENRNISGEGLFGAIDEVRFSNTVRGANDFIFAVPEPSSLGVSLLGGLALALRRRRA